MSQDNMLIFLLDNGRYRGAIIDSTEMLRLMQEKHETGVLETFALGETYTAAGLLTSMLKGKDRMIIRFECQGPIKGISVETTAEGNVRGYLMNNPIPLSKIPESLDLSDLFGPGFLSIIKFPEGSRQSFTGQVMIEYGSIAKDLAGYYTTSENTPTAFNLSVKFNKDGSIKGAGGIFIQRLPDSDTIKGDDERTAEIEQSLVNMDSIGVTLSAGTELSEIVFNNFRKFQPDVIAERSINFSCSCNRELFETYLKGLPENDRTDLAENGPFPLKTTCHNCNTVYEFSKHELRKMFSL